MAYKYRTALALTLFLTASQFVSAAEMYRYEDNDGRVVWGDSVPPQLVSKGFSVYDTNGYLLRTVDRTVTLEQEEGAQREREEEARLAEQKARQQQIDNMLLRRYGTLKDYQDRRVSAMNTLNNRKAAIGERLDAANRNIDEINETVLLAERENRNPPAGLTSLLANLEGVRKGLMNEMARANEEIAQYVQQADDEYQRLSELLDKEP